ncbi:MAG: hypothetical protein R3Y04_03825 [Rikenellaceae bacterium]
MKRAMRSEILHSVNNKLTLTALLFVLLCSCSTSELKIKTSGFEFDISNKGEVVSIKDMKHGREYLDKKSTSPLLSLRIDTTYIYPSSAKWNEQNKQLTLGYGSNRNVTIALEQKAEYFTMEIVGYQLPDDQHLDLALWGSYSTTISEVVGECVGVVHDDDFAFGIRALNIKTLGGCPVSESDIAPFYDIFATTSLVDIADSLKVLYRGNTAVHTENGSKVHAYTRNRDKDRVIEMWNHDAFTAPAYDDGGVIGSKLAVFGSPRDEVMDYLESIVVGEDMPYPQMNGEWNKKSPYSSQAYIIYPFNENNIEQAIEFTKKCGLNYLYHGGPFSTWGNFELNPAEFPSGIKGLKECVEKAAKEGIKLGIHTLSNFTTANDKYVSPIPDKRLAKVGSSPIKSDIDAKSTEIEIESPLFFNQMRNNSLHAVMINQELIRYERVSETAPWKLLGCERGAWGTTPSQHKSGDVASKLLDHAYNVFLTDIDLTKEVSRNIANIFNETGIEQISFDGLEGNWSTGLGQYGLSLMIKEWWDNLNPELRNNINDASVATHYNWYIFTRMNWGEPWYGGFRESQVAYRMMNQDFYRRNLMPCMLGWFTYGATTSIEDVEWLLARSAAFDAGYTLVTNGGAVESNGASDKIIAAIGSWERARLTRAFPDDLKVEMESTKREYTLEELSENSWNLYKLNLERFSHENFERQPGEPLVSNWKFNNIYERQPINFIIKTDEEISDITITIAGYSTINIPFNLKSNEVLKYEGDNTIAVYDIYWNKLRELKVKPDSMIMPQGENTITFGCKFQSSDSKKRVYAEVKTRSEAILLSSR